MKIISHLMDFTKWCAIVTIIIDLYSPFISFSTHHTLYYHFLKFETDTYRDSYMNKDASL